MSFLLSQFLPHDFRPEDGIGLIAGKELYPEMVARRMLEAGVRVGLIAFEGETRESLFQMFPEKDRIRLKVGKMGKLLKALKDFRVKWAMMAGQITPGRLFKDLHPDLKAIALLAKLREKNAESIFGAVSEEIAKLGIQLIDARGFLDDQMAEIRAHDQNPGTGAPGFHPARNRDGQGDRPIGHWAGGGHSQGSRRRGGGI